MSSHPFLVGPATIITNDPQAPVLSDAGIVCQKDRITQVGKWTDLRKDHPQATQFDAGGRVMMPGLINAHHHLYSTFARGMPFVPGTPLNNFPEVLEGIWWRLDRALDLDSVEAGAWPPVLDCLRWGATTIVDHHASPSAIRGSLARLAKVCKSAGVRASLCYEITDRNGLADAALGLEENLAFLHSAASDPMLVGLVGLHASFTVSDETLALVQRTAPANTPIHIHCAEDAADIAMSKDRYGRDVIDRLTAHGLLRKNSVIVHGVHLGDADLRRVAEAGAFLVHNPESNANNAVGALDVMKAMSIGVHVALGTDGMASNMLRAAKSAYLMARHTRRDPSSGMDLPRRLLLENNAKFAQAIFAEPSIGVITKGAPADVCIVDYDPPTPLDASTLDAHLTFGITEAPIAATVSSGVVRFDHGKFPGMDVGAIDAQVLEGARSVWAKLRV